ncbi:hypothetical protein IOD16_23425 [Saccharothrix sp. 6-C]|uniref:hypothetical protein n=1 Tax=Saccharothrix sp. 6-C TaxID=2781735 RepID=UPI0019175CA7|nr:hypothetical protein [Saccharothrix sp. 6-C]QQQ74163.1 hypothetical protein IOD16_23425 [Saccharothrix sp. 6-C]
MGCYGKGPSDDPPPPSDPAVALAERVAAFVAALREDAPYRPPTAEQRRAFTEALTALGPTPAAGDDDLRSLGFAVRRTVDEETGRPYALAAAEAGTEHSWGLYVVDLSRPVRVAVQVPHPANDLRTAEIGLDLFRRVPGAVLSVAGTHRRVAAGAGDAAHRTDSLFHAAAERHSRDRVPQVQLHGFDDDSLPSADLVLSPGAAREDPSITRVADDLEGLLRVCRAWARDCGDLEGRRNRQGAVAAEHGAFFAHVELNRITRVSPEQWEPVVHALEKALGG